MYDWKITLRKFVETLVEILIVGTIAYLTQNELYLFLLPLLEALRNYLKHGAFRKND